MHIFISVFLAAVPSFGTATTAPKAPLRVLIDAGHGGRDHGTTRANVHESDLTLAISRRLFERLKRDPRFVPELTRHQDLALGLADRTRKARQFRTDLFLSLHVNSSPDAKAHGAEFYYENRLAPDEESMFLAYRENSGTNDEHSPLNYDFVTKANYPPDVSAIISDLLDGQRMWRSSVATRAIQGAWAGRVRREGGTIRQAPFHVLKKISAPSVLVELGYLTNAHDYAELTDATSQKRMTEDLYRGLISVAESFAIDYQHSDAIR